MKAVNCVVAMVFALFLNSAYADVTRLMQM